MRGVLGSVRLLGPLVLIILCASCGEDKPSADGDLVPPAKVSDLAVASVGDSSATITWTAPGDDDEEGTASRYDLRFLSLPDTFAAWWDSAAAAVSSLPGPGPTGHSESLNVRGLEPATAYYFGLKTADEALNWSALSNVAACTTAAGDTAPGHERCVPFPIAPPYGSVMANGCEFEPDTIKWVFRWSSCLHADRYHLIVDYPGIVMPGLEIDDSTVTGTTYLFEAPSLYVEYGYQYGWTWKVRARVDGIWGDWTRPWPFSVEEVNTDCPPGLPNLDPSMDGMRNGRDPMRQSPFLVAPLGTREALGWTKSKMVPVVR
jgi:hypothetical protein